MLEITFARGTSLFREADRKSDLPMVRNGPPGTFVIVPRGVAGEPRALRISLPTDQIVSATDEGGAVRAAFGGMRFEGRADEVLVFRRERELAPESELSPERSHTMTLRPSWVSAIEENEREVWTAIVYKIVPAHVWRTAEASGQFTGSAADERDGFIHLSTARQVAGTAARHFAGIDDLLLVAVSAADLDLRWELSRGGDVFPHLYGPLPMSAVRWSRPLESFG